MFSFTPTCKIIGKISEDIVAELKRNGVDYENSYNISDQEVVDAYKMCDIVSFPSMYEGFGMPVLEGFATGRIVVTSNIEPIRTIAEDGAIMVDPLDISSISKGFLLAINNAEEREKRIKRGKDIVLKYTPQNIAAMYQNLYNKI